VTGFILRKGARAANSGRGRSSSSWKPMQSQWCARLTDLRFQYSRNVTALGRTHFSQLLAYDWFSSICFSSYGMLRVFSTIVLKVFLFPCSETFGLLIVEWHRK
jgi:hypothetical protein